MRPSVTATIKLPDGKDTKRATYSHVIVAVGIVPNTEDLGLEKRSASPPIGGM